MLTQFYVEYIFTTMVISCVAYGCTNRVGKECDISQIGTDIFNNIGDHYADHTTGEGDHLTPLLRLIVAKYVSIRLKLYGQDYAQMVAHKNIPSKRHLLTKSVIFSGH